MPFVKRADNLFGGKVEAEIRTADGTLEKIEFGIKFKRPTQLDIESGVFVKTVEAGGLSQSQLIERYFHSAEIEDEKNKPITDREEQILALYDYPELVTAACMLFFRALFAGRDSGEG